MKQRTFNLLLFVVLIVIVIVYVKKTGGISFRILENFSIDNKKVVMINNGLDSIIACTNAKNCGSIKGVVSNFGEFKKSIGYPKFSVILFNELLNARKNKNSHLTESEITSIVEKGKYESSFK